MSFAMTEAFVPQQDHPLPPVKPNRLYQVAAWVVIVAGVVFILAVIFWSGFVVAGHHGCRSRHHPGMSESYAPLSVVPPSGAGPGPGMAAVPGVWAPVTP